MFETEDGFKGETLSFRLSEKIVHAEGLWRRIGPIEIELSAGDKIHLSIPDRPSFEAVCRILELNDLNWFGSLSLCGQTLPGALLTQPHRSALSWFEAMPKNAALESVLRDRWLSARLARMHGDRGLEAFAQAFDLRDGLDRPVKLLAKAERQRVNAAVLSLVRPRLVIVDATEPIESSSKKVVAAVLSDLLKEGASILLLSSGSVPTWRFLECPRVHVPVGWIGGDLVHLARGSGESAGRAGRRWASLDRNVS